MGTTFMVIGAVVSVVALVVCLVAERRDHAGRIVFKMIASTGFLVIAAAGGAFQDPYGIIVFVALILCWFGDLALALPGDAIFLAGLVSFLLGHVGFAAAFFVHGVALAWCAVAMVAIIPVCVVVVRWMYPHLPNEMRAPVLAYVAVITAMVVLAAGATGAGAHVILLLGAVAFYVSDIFVARDRFVNPGYSNRVLGLPLYYLGVVLLAFSIAAEHAAQ